MDIPAPSVWSFVTYVVLPMSFVLLLLLMSGVQFLENIGHWICALKLQIGNIRLRLPQIILIFASMSFVLEHYALHRLSNTRETYYRMNDSDRWKAQLWRHQRNWWLSFFSVILWSIVSRFSGMITRFRAEIKEIRESKKAK